MRQRLLPHLTAGAALTAAALLPVQVSANQGTILEPTGKWQMNHNKATCTLARQFGASKTPNLLIFERYGPTPSFQLTIISDHFRFFEQGQIFWQQIDDGDRVPLETVMPGKSGKITSLFISKTGLTKRPLDPSGRDKSTAAALSPAEEASVTSLTFGFPGKAVTFRTGPPRRRIRSDAYLHQRAGGKLGPGSATAGHSVARRYADIVAK